MVEILGEEKLRIVSFRFHRLSEGQLSRWPFLSVDFLLWEVGIYARELSL